MVQQSVSDLDLVRGIKEGDQFAFERLVERFRDRVYRLALRISRNPQDAEEITQDVFLTIYQKIGTFEARSAFSTWLYRIATNAALMKIRRRQSVSELAIEDYLPQFTEEGHHRSPVTDWGEDPECPLLDQEGREMLKSAISALPPDYQVPVLLRDVEGLLNTEAAEVLGVSVPALKARLHRARLVLRGMLANYFRERESQAAA
ncbi:MAG: sigma-70 family RNA polymerase sigma factor [Candidatus Methylomirabilis oxyfera]|nr:sigma-70 family RNA polymerase sigma factor [Candidatus Methylomirabilis oxyfera]